VKAINCFEQAAQEAGWGTELFRYNGRANGRYLTDRFCRYVTRRLPERPVFGLLHFMDLHEPYVPPVRMYTAARHLCPTRAAPSLTPWDRMMVRKRYAACARHTDGLLRTTIETFVKLRRRPVLVFITADHGEEFWDHGDSPDDGPAYRLGVGHCHTLYNELVHVPLIVHARGMDCPVNGQRLCSLVDVRPTILSVLQLPAPNAMDGLDLSRASHREYVVAEFMYSGPERKALISDYLKMIARQGGADAEVYDLKEDPLERHNIISSARPDVQRIRRLWNETFAGQPFEPVQTETDEGTLNQLKALGYF